MKKFLMMAALAAFAATPAMANEADMQKKIDAKFSKIDTNSDGMISEQEHTTAMSEMFDDADADSNGSISKEEMREHKMEEMKEWKDKKNG